MKHIAKKIDAAHQESNKALQQFVSTEEVLKKQNEVITAALDEAEATIQKLQELKEQGMSKHQENAGIIQRIGQIVRGSNNDETKA